MSCPICDRSFESGNEFSNEFLIHVNGCLDSQEQKLIPKNFHVQSEDRIDPLIKKQKERQQLDDCVVCGKTKATAAHIKKCGKQYGVGTSQLIKLVGNNEAPNANPNLQNIIFKDSNLDEDRLKNNLFTENDASQIENSKQLNDANNFANQLFNRSFNRNASINQQPNKQLYKSPINYSKYFLKKPAAKRSQQQLPNEEFATIHTKK